MADDSRTDAQKFAMMRARRAERVWLEVGQRDNQASFDDVVGRTDLDPLGRAWTSINRPVAISLLERLLHRDLAYGAQVMPEQRARWLATWFVDSERVGVYWVADEDRDDDRGPPPEHDHACFRTWNQAQVCSGSGHPGPATAPERTMTRDIGQRCPASSQGGPRGTRTPDIHGVNVAL